MKKQLILWLAMIAVALPLSTGCFNNSKSRLSRIIAEVNRDCPVNTGIGTFDRIDYVNDTVVFMYTLDNPMMSVDKLKKKKAEARKIFANNLYKGSVNQVLQEIVSAGATLRLHIGEVLSTDAIEFGFSKEQLQQAIAAPAKDDDETLLQSEAMMLNLMSPVVVDQYTTIIGGEKSPKAFTYLYTYDDASISSSFLTKEYIQTLKESHARQLVSQMKTPGGKALKTCLQACVNTHRSLSTHYEGEKTGHVFEYSFSPEELSSLISRSSAVVDPDNIINGL